jgi:hypothetical protein
VALNRWCMGHCRLSYLLNNEERPEYIPCNSNCSLKHILTDCVDVADIRQTTSTLHLVYLQMLQATQF